MAHPGGPGTCWESSAERPSESWSTHQMPSPLHTGRRIVLVESPQGAAHAGGIQLSVSSSRKAMGSRGSGGINTRYLLLASKAAPAGAAMEGAQPPGTCLILGQLQLGEGFPLWFGMNAGVIGVYYLYSVSHLSLTSFISCLLSLQSHYNNALY